MDRISRPHEHHLIEELVTRLRTHQDAADQLEHAAARALGVHRTAARCVEVLSRTGSLTTGELARHAGLTSGAMTSLLDGLEDAGAIRRFRLEGGDRRRIHVELTPHGREVASTVWGTLHDPLRDVLRAHDPATLLALRDVLDDATAVLAGRPARSAAEPTTAVQDEPAWSVERPDDLAGSPPTTKRPRDRAQPPARWLGASSG